MSLAALDAPEKQIQSMVSTAELSRRPSRPPDYEAENRALVMLAQEMATAPDGILQKLADTALVLCRAHSAGLSLLGGWRPEEQLPLARHRWAVGSSR